MTEDHLTSAQTTHTLGMRLAQAREAAGLTLEQASQRTRLPQRSLQRFESGEWTRAADVFERGQLRSYARMLGVDSEGWFAQGENVAPPLVSHQRTPPMQRFADTIGRKLVYAVITAMVAVPIWLAATRSPVAGPAAPASVSLETPPAQAVPAVARASMTPMPAPSATEPAPAAGAQALVVHFDGDSWMEALDRDGKALERGLVKSGETRQYAPGQLSRIKLGNASHLRVERAGLPVDITPYIRGDVARFAVSSDGLPQTSIENK